MLEKQEEGRNSQFLYGCDTDWNLNHELICWLKYWFKVYKEKTITDLSFHKFETKIHHIELLVFLHFQNYQLQ